MPFLVIAAQTEIFWLWIDVMVFLGCVPTKLRARDTHFVYKDQIINVFGHYILSILISFFNVIIGVPGCRNQESKSCSVRCKVETDSDAFFSSKILCLILFKVMEQSSSINFLTKVHTSGIIDFFRPDLCTSDSVRPSLYTFKMDATVPYLTSSSSEITFMGLPASFTNKIQWNYFTIWILWRL